MVLERMITDDGGQSTSISRNVEQTIRSRSLLETRDLEIGAATFASVVGVDTHYLSSGRAKAEVNACARSAPDDSDSRYAAGTSRWLYRSVIAGSWHARRQCCKVRACHCSEVRCLQVTSSPSHT